MGKVAADAIKFAVRPDRVLHRLLLFLQRADRMARSGGKARYHMRSLSDIAVALQADLNAPLEQQRLVSARMDSMATEAHARGNGGVFVFLFERCHIVTVCAESRDRGRQQMFIL